MSLMYTSPRLSSDLDHCVVIEYGHKNIVTVQPDNEEAFMERIKINNFF